MFFHLQCNNPQTKEPKLQAAMRIVPEWKDYDQEIKQFWDKIYKKNNNNNKTGKIFCLMNYFKLTYSR